MGSVEQGAVGPDPHVVLNDDTSARCHKPLLADRDVPAVHGVVLGHDSSPSCDEDIIPDVDSVAGVQDAVRVNVTMLPNDHVPATGDGADYDELVD